MNWRLLGVYVSLCMLYIGYMLQFHASVISNVRLQYRFSFHLFICTTHSQKSINTRSYSVSHASVCECMSAFDVIFISQLDQEKRFVNMEISQELSWKCKQAEYEIGH